MGWIRKYWFRLFGELGLEEEGEDEEGVGGDGEEIF